MDPNPSEASPAELDYIAAMSRKNVVDAYTQWTSLSRAEEACLAVAFKPGRRVLDLGCGSGRLALQLGGEASSYVGVDASEEMLAVARKNCASLVFVHADILAFETDASSWDVILLMGNVIDCLQPLDRREALLSRCTGWLRPGGAIVGSSHVTRPGQVRGYFSEVYHGATVENYRAPLGELVLEVESHGLEVALACRDDRKRPADWCYWTACLSK